jgi:hypothetical protein
VAELEEEATALFDKVSAAEEEAGAAEARVHALAEQLKAAQASLQARPSAYFKLGPAHAHHMHGNSKLCHRHMPHLLQGSVC